MAKENMFVRHSFLTAMERLSMTERGRLFTAMLEYSISGRVPELGGKEDILWPVARDMIDADNAKYRDAIEQRQRAGQASANARQQPSTVVNERQPTTTPTSTTTSTTTPITRDKAPAHKYGSYKNVLLTDEDLQKLKDEFPDWEERIERLSEYMASSGKTYKSCLATIRVWSKKDKAPTPTQKRNAPPSGKYTGRDDSELLRELLKEA